MSTVHVVPHGGKAYKFQVLRNRWLRTLHRIWMRSDKTAVGIDRFMH